MIEKSWQGIYCVAIVALLAGLLYQHWQIISATVPLDLYEGTMVLITGIIADGHNPYTRPFQPQAADVYPPLYNILVASLSSFFGNTFQLHRIVSAVFILLASGLAGFATWKKCHSAIAAATTAVLMYAALLFYATPVSSTNAQGMALFMAGLIVPWHLRYSTGSLIFSLICALLAFYTKQYFILGIAILCLYLFLYVSIYRALFLGATFAACLALSIWMVHRSSPYYLDITFFAPAAAINDLQSWPILALQLRFFANTYAGLLVSMLIVSVLTLKRMGLDGVRGTVLGACKLAGSGLRGPMLSRPIDYFWFGLFWSTLVIISWLGRNPGNYMTYLFQLMSPFLLIAGVSLLREASRKLWILPCFLLLTFYQVYAILHKDFSVDQGSWGKIEKMIAGSDDVLATQMLVNTLLQQGKEVFQDGHTFYFPLASSKPGWLVKEREEDRVVAVWRDYLNKLYGKIQRQEFDLILVSPWEMEGIFVRNPPPLDTVSGKEFLSRYYVVEEKIKLSMTDRHGGGTYVILVWRPKHIEPGS